MHSISFHGKSGRSFLFVTAKVKEQMCHFAAREMGYFIPYKKRKQKIEIKFLHSSQPKKALQEELLYVQNFQVGSWLDFGVEKDVIFRHFSFRHLLLFIFLFFPQLDVFVSGSDSHHVSFSNGYGSSSRFHGL